jgi:hypothetical protein
VHAEQIAGFVDRHGDRTAGVLWAAAMALVKQAGDAGLESHHGRWTGMPELELRWLRNQLAHALALAHLAVAMQEDLNEENRELTRELGDVAAAHGRRQRERRERTLRAQEARLRYQQIRRDHGREPTREEKFPWLYETDGDPAVTET